MTASLIQVDDPSAYVTLAVLVAALAGLAAGVNRLSGLGHARDDLVAAARATLQLGVVGLVIAAVLQSWWLTLLFVAMMVTVASTTAGRRLARHGRWPLASIPVCVGALPVTAVLLLRRLVPTTPIAVVPIVGILVGGAMTATTLAGRRTLDGLRNRRGEVEAALSLGLPDRDARLLIIRDDAALALLPGLDQTRTVGLVTLPGAFVGMLLGGATPAPGGGGAAAGPGGVAARAGRRHRVHARARRSVRLRLNSLGAHPRLWCHACPPLTVTQQQRNPAAPRAAEAVLEVCQGAGPTRMPMTGASRHQVNSAGGGSGRALGVVSRPQTSCDKSKTYFGGVGFTASARRRFLLWGCAGILTCLALCVLARRSPETLNRWDQVLQIGPDWWRGAASWLEGPLVWLSYAFGTVVSVVGTAVVAGLLLAKRRNRAAVYVVLVILGTILVTSLLKLIVDLPRPVVEDPILQYASSGMPSGHASNIAAATTAACVLSAIHVRKRARRRLVLVVGVLMALIVGLDRLMLGVHTLTEVAAGYALGVGVGLLTAYLFDPSLRRNAVLVKESS